MWVLASQRWFLALTEYPHVVLQNKKVQEIRKCTEWSVILLQNCEKECAKFSVLGHCTSLALEPIFFIKICHTKLNKIN